MPAPPSGQAHLSFMDESGGIKCCPFCKTVLYFIVVRQYASAGKEECAVELDLTQRQGQTLSPQMIQSTAVLQMASQELAEYLETVLQENPVLELEEHHSDPDTADDLRQKLEWLEANDPQNREYHRQDSQAETDPLRSCGVTGQEESLYRHLQAQLSAMELDADTALCARLVAASLNQNGWLDEDIAVIALESGQSADDIQRALAVVQSLEPAGVAARDLSECLCIQLRRQRPVNELAVRIAQGYLEALSKSRYSLIARSLGVEQREVLAACQVIRGLNPRPGSSFAANRSPAYITPDIIVTNLAGRFELAHNDRLFPALHISPYYVRLLKESDDEQVQDYLAGKLRQAKWTMRAVDQRKATLTACVQCILEIQEDFFRMDRGCLKPMSLADIAQRVGLHESTVSRAVSGKYLQCSKGTYPLSYFFSRRLGPGEVGNDVSPDGAKLLLKQLIEKEDKRKPLSDQKLCERMAAAGCVLSRRTVAKYRDELGISGTSGRRLRD